MKIFLFLFTFVSVTFASFIASPVQTASKGHFIYDRNNDNISDEAFVFFLSAIDSSYLKNTLDSVRVENATVFAMRAMGKKLILSLKDCGTFTGKRTLTLYQKGVTPVTLTLADSIAPNPIAVNIISGNGIKNDTLAVEFSENVTYVGSSLKLFTKDGLEKELDFKHVNSSNKKMVKFLLSQRTAENISFTDSVLLGQGLVCDSMQLESHLKKLPLKGISPFKIITNPQAVFTPIELSTAPVFESKILPIGSEFPQNKIGMALDFGNDEFTFVIENSLKEKGMENAGLSHVMLRMDMSVYSHAGEYLTGSHLDVDANSFQLSGNGRVFFFWNFMDSKRRLAGSGVYLVRMRMQVFYAGKLLIDDAGTLHAFGAVRK